MSINFPNNPALDDLFTDSSNVEWKCIDATAGDVQWARTGFSSPQNYMGKNYIINPTFSVNQRGFDGNWGGLADTDFGFDRWRKLGTDIIQPIEDGNYRPNTTYTLSGINVTEAQIVSPASGTWEITVPNTANEIKLEEGSVKTPFEYPDIATELVKCQRYYVEYSGTSRAEFYAFAGGAFHPMLERFPVEMRAIPSTVFLGSIGTNISAVETFQPQVNGFSYRTTVTAQGECLFNAGAYSAEAEL